MKKILEVVYPPITSYPMIAQPLSISFSDKERVMPWFVPRYIQTVAFTQKDELDLGKSMMNFVDNMCEAAFEIKTYKLPRDIVNFKWSNFTKFIQDCIEKNYYVRLSLNMYYFSCSPAYNNKQFMHVPMIYGYDDKAKIFYVADFFKNSVYSFEQVTFRELQLAYENASFEGIENGTRFDYLYYITLWKRNPEIINPSSNLFGIVSSIDGSDVDLLELNSIITDYINCKYNPRTCESNFNTDGVKYYYGLQCYDAIAQNFENGYCDTRALHLLSDRVKAFIIKLEYLFSKKIITNTEYESLDEKVALLYQLSIQNRNLNIKSNLHDGSKKYCERIIRNLFTIKQKDLEFCKELLYTIERYVDKT